MAYQAPTIGMQGLSIPSYADILAYLIAQYQAIYGANVYLGVDSADYQWISSVALALNDCMQAAQLAYNARSPVTAVGADLDGIVKINGVARKVASASTSAVTITGVANAVITNGLVKDVNGYLWALPPTVAIGAGGTITVTATCQTTGIVNANAGTLTIIATPAYGWVSVTNAAAALPGLPVETDAQLRARQALSVSLPSQTMLSGTIAAIAATAGVSRYYVVENPTGSVDANGTPAHSITCVVEGGADADIARAIYDNRGIGCLTNGTTPVTVADPYTGETMTISFSRPSYVPMYVTVSVHGLAGYTTATSTAIQTAITNYLNSLQIGQAVVLSELYGAALSVRPNPDAPMFSIRALTLDVTPSPTATSDVAVAYDHVAQGNLANVLVTLV